MKKIIGVLAALAMSVTCLTACGKEKNEEKAEDKFIGKWECTEITADGMTMTGEFMGVPVAAMFQIEFKDAENGSVISVGEDPEEFKWKADGDTVKLESEEDDEPVELKKEGDMLVISEKDEESEVTMKLKKVDKFTEVDPDAFGGEDEE